MQKRRMDRAYAQAITAMAAISAGYLPGSPDLKEEEIPLSPEEREAEAERTKDRLQKAEAKRKRRAEKLARQVQSGGFNSSK